uniref:thiol oxidase n=1 Tax=viral metagenome TaxID=1070528 RepID=A0A6C0C4G5_9ZZZZ
MSGLYRWAPPTWIFFHTFAAKINKIFFETNRDQCLNIIKMVCSCLPCPECTKHAIKFMNNVDSRNVKTKEDLINMLFTFHNTVNARLGKSQFPKESLVMYTQYRMDITLVNFVNGFSGKYGSIMGGMISTLGKRKSIANGMQDWLRKHWNFFQ